MVVVVVVGSDVVTGGVPVLPPVDPSGGSHVDLLPSE